MNQITNFFDEINKSRLKKSYDKTLKSPLKFISTIISWTVFTLLVLCAAFLIYYYVSTKIYSSKGQGYEPAISLYTIISQSMSPNIEVYDVVIVQKVKSPEDIKVGDVISFNSTDFQMGKKISVTHRVIEVMIDAQGKYKYTTKGDNNFIKDAKPVSYESIMGKVSIKLPQLGRIQFFLASSSGWLLVIVLPALYIIIKDIIKILRVSGIAKKIPPNSRLFPLFNKPLLLPYKGILKPVRKRPEYVKEKDKTLKSNLSKKSKESKETIKKEEISLSKIFEDLKNISK